MGRLSGPPLFLFADTGDKKGGIQIFNSCLERATENAQTVVLSDFGYGRVGKIRFALEFFTRMLFSPPRVVIAGHVNFAVLAKRLCRLRKTPYVVVVFGTEAWIELPKARREALASADAIWSISRFTRDICIAKNQLPPEKFRILPCTIDPDEFSPGEKPADLVARYQLAGKKVLLSVGRLDDRERKKGFDTVIRALPRILKAQPNLVLQIIGKGGDLERLRALARECGVGECVQFLTDVSRKELPRHYRLADCFCMPSSQEGFGIVYLEALATGVPVVAGQDGATEPLRDAELGWQVRWDSTDAVAEACLAALAGSDPRTRPGWLRERVVQEFGWARFRDRVRELLPSK